MEPFKPSEMEREWHAEQTIKLGELVECGLLDWDSAELAGTLDGFGERADHVRELIVSAYWLQEIAITPVRAWTQRLGYVLKHEITPKYAQLYAAMDSGELSALNSENEYLKRREIVSDYPEALISDNADYASAGTDTEYQRIRVRDGLDTLARFQRDIASVDAMIVCDLKKLFISVWRYDVAAY